MNRSVKIGWILMVAAIAALSAHATGLDVVTNMPLGSNRGESTCSAMTITDTGDAYLVGQSIDKTEKKRKRKGVSL